MWVFYPLIFIIVPSNGNNACFCKYTHWRFLFYSGFIVAILNLKTCSKCNIFPVFTSYNHIVWVQYYVEIDHHFYSFYVKCLYIKLSFLSLYVAMNVQKACGKCRDNVVALPFCKINYAPSYYIISKWRYHPCLYCILMIYIPRSICCFIRRQSEFSPIFSESSEWCMNKNHFIKGDTVSAYHQKHMNLGQNKIEDLMGHVK